MSAITTHVLDTSIGQPARYVAVALTDADGEVVGRGHTDQDGRCRELMSMPLQAGRYRISFDVAAYFLTRDIHAFYPVVHIDFEVFDAAQHYHVPLLISPFAYSTYRGS
jgi:5-hydroxyisourate hydrolase